jgi:hypothetical protein
MRAFTGSWASNMSKLVPWTMKLGSGSILLVTSSSSECVNDAAFLFLLYISGSLTADQAIVAAASTAVKTLSSTSRSHPSSSKVMHLSSDSGSPGSSKEQKRARRRVRSRSKSNLSTSTRLACLRCALSDDSESEACETVTTDLRSAF